jgi:hypothetical protein
MNQLFSFVEKETGKEEEEDEEQEEVSPQEYEDALGLPGK